MRKLLRELHEQILAKQAREKEQLQQNNSTSPSESADNGAQPSKRNSESQKSKETVAKEYKVELDKLEVNDLLKVVNKSDLLEISGLSILEKVLQEFVIFAIMTMTISFFALVFYMSSAGDSTSNSSLTSAIVLLIGGSANIPVSSSSLYDDEKIRDKLTQQAQRSD